MRIVTRSTNNQYSVNILWDCTFYGGWRVIGAVCFRGVIE